MKKSIFTVFTIIFAIMFGSAAMAAKPVPPPVQPPSQNSDTIKACVKKNNGQLRVVSAGTNCLPSETAISWNAAGSQGSSGVVSTGTISGAVGAVAGNSTAWAFAGPTVNAVTTATERITGAVQALLGTTLSGTATFNYDLCYRAAGTSDVLTNFGGANSSAGDAINTLGVPFPAIASVVPGSGTWEVGYCLLNSGTVDLDNNGLANGWIIVTE